MTETPAPDALAEDLMVPIRSALRFAASHSCITSAQERAILTALRANDQRNAVIEEMAMVAEGERYAESFVKATLNDGNDWPEHYNDACNDIAAAIRARKEQP